jgi:hypothetical protein
MSRYASDDDRDEPARPRGRRDDYDEDYNRYDPPPHSGLGIASCIIGGCTFVFALVLVVIAGVMEASHPGGIDENSPTAMFLGFLIFVCLIAALVGLVLGIVGATMRNRNKLFAGLGIGVNSLLLLGLLVLMIVGALTEAVTD